MPEEIYGEERFVIGKEKRRGFILSGWVNGGLNLRPNIDEPDCLEVGFSYLLKVFLPNF